MICGTRGSISHSAVSPPPPPSSSPRTTVPSHAGTPRERDSRLGPPPKCQHPLPHLGARNGSWHVAGGRKHWLVNKSVFQNNTSRERFRFQELVPTRIGQRALVRGGAERRAAARRRLTHLCSVAAEAPPRPSALPPAISADALAHVTRWPNPRSTPAHPIWLDLWERWMEPSGPASVGQSLFFHGSFLHLFCKPGLGSSLILFLHTPLPTSGNARQPHTLPCPPSS